MKHLPYIFINQNRLSRYPGLDLIDGAILAYCRTLVISTNKKIVNKRKIVDDVEYTWINSAQLIRSMPLIKINNERSIRSRLSKLVKAGLLLRYDESKNMPYYTLSYNAFKMYKKVQYKPYKDDSFLQDTLPENHLENSKESQIVDDILNA